VRELILTGGEPFLLPDIDELVEVTPIVVSCS
jgi:organic radical activating enzyme